MADINCHKDAFATIQQEWNKAEADIKVAEQINHNISIPSIFELRYAGRRLIEALNLLYNDGNDEAINDLLQDAEFNCLRARHDAIDSATSKISSDLQIAASQLGHEAILGAFDQFPKLVGMVTAIREKIAISREKREDRTAIYESIEINDFHELAALYRKFLSCEPVMIEFAKKRGGNESLVT